MVYLIGSRTRPTCKIGYTLRDESERLRELRIIHGDDIVVLASMPGARQEEKRLHKLFAEKHVNGEWYKMCPEIAAAFGFDLNAPDQLWVTHLKYVFKFGGGTRYTDIMGTEFAPSAQEAIISAKKKAKANETPVEGYCVSELALNIPAHTIQKAHALLPKASQQTAAIKPRTTTITECNAH